MLKAVCPKEPGSPRQYTHNLVQTCTYPTGYSYPDGKAIKPAEILVRFDAVGACNSDIKIAAQGSDHPRMHGRNLWNNPAVLGHEVSLTVIAVGEALKGKYKPGERYVVNAETILNEEKVTFGYKLPGGYRQFGVYGEMLLNNDNGSSLIKIPNDMSYLAAASLEPYACCFNTLDLHRPEIRSLRPHGYTWLMGAGPMCRAFVESMLSRGNNYPSKLAVTEISKDRMGKFRRTVGKAAEQKGIQVSYIEANDVGRMFVAVDSFFGIQPKSNRLDDVLLMFSAPKPVLQHLVKGALDRMDTAGSVFDVFAGLKDEVIIDYKRAKIPLKAMHYTSSMVIPNTHIRIDGFSGLAGKHLEEARDAYGDNKIDPYSTMIAAVASLDQLPNVLLKMEAGEIDGKCIMLPNASTHLRFTTPDTLNDKLDMKRLGKLGLNAGGRLTKKLQKGKFDDELSRLIFEQFIV